VVVQFSLRGTQMAKVLFFFFFFFFFFLFSFWSLIMEEQIWNKFPAQTQGAPVVTGFKVAGAFFFDSFAKMLGIEFFWISM
jgi:hypothetical protein